MTMMLTANGLETLPLNQKWLNSERMVEQYSRGKYLIVLAHSQLDPYLTDATPGGDFLEFKQSQGFDVEDLEAAKAVVLILVQKLHQVILVPRILVDEIDRLLQLLGFLLRNEVLKQVSLA